MAWTNVGFDGTINEAQWASLSGLLGNDYVAAGNGDCVVTAVGGARSVSVAAGSLYGDGVLSTNSAPETVAMTTPVNGQWYVIALRRTWSSNTAALVAIAGATTTTTTPTAPPTSFPTLNTNKGVLTDQPIAWAWCNSANTTVVVYDIRLKAVKSLPPVVANQGERDAKFMTPTQGLQVWRDDLGAVETYFGLYNSSTNPGGRDTAGWYQTGRQSGIVPVRPSSVTAVSGSATQTAIGTISFSACSIIQLNGVFTSAYRNYRVEFVADPGSPTNLYIRMSNGGTIDSSAVYNYNAAHIQGTSSPVSWNNGPSSTTSITFMDPQAIPGATSLVCDITQPAIATRTVFHFSATGWNGSYRSTAGMGMNVGTSAYDGIAFGVTAGNMTGTVTIYGYNN